MILQTSSTSPHPLHQRAFMDPSANRFPLSPIYRRGESSVEPAKELQRSRGDKAVVGRMG